MNETRPTLPLGGQIAIGAITPFVVLGVGALTQSEVAFIALTAIALLLAPYLWIRHQWHGYTAGLLMVASGTLLLFGVCGGLLGAAEIGVPLMLVGGAMLYGVVLLLRREYR